MPEYLAPGVYVEETSFRPKSIEGVSTSTTAFVGPTRKGPLTGTPEVVTSFGEFGRTYGGFTDLSFSNLSQDLPNYLAHAVRSFFDNGGARLYIGRTFVAAAGDDGVAASSFITGTDTSSDPHALFRARMPGSGLNGAITVFEKLTPAAVATLNAAPTGSLVRYMASANLAQPATVSGGSPPFTLDDDDQLSLTVSGAAVSVTFNGSAAEVSSSALADPLEILADTTLDVTVGGVAQSIALPTGSTALATLVNLLNVSLRHGYVRLEGTDTLVIGSDMRGSSAAVSVADNDTLGFSGGAASAPNASDNVANLANVTVAELNTLLTAAGGTVVAALTTDANQLRLSTVAIGETAALTITDNAAATAFGLSPVGTAVEGEDGSAAQYFIKTTTGWVSEDGVTPLPAATTTSRTDLVTVNVEAADADGNTIVYEDLGLHTTHPLYIGTVLTETPTRRGDALQNPYFLDINGAITPFQLHADLFGGDDEVRYVMSGGNDGVTPTESATGGNDTGYAQALLTLEEIDDISIVAAPGHSRFGSYAAVRNRLITHAELMKYRIAVLDTPPGLLPGDALQERGAIDSKYAALYYPWLVIANPLARPGNESIPKEITIPPSGAIAGIYARNDNSRGVWKAPANEVVRGVLRFEREINHRQQETLNPYGVNCLRYFFGRGNQVWGARTTSSDPEWKYVNVRRYFIYLEHSIDRSTQWAVFEPNGPRLWANIRDTVSAFLYNEWRSGALLGTTPEEAFFVRCDRSTMTQNDLDNGRLICEIGVAALYPAEFVIFRIGQKTADARS